MKICRNKKQVDQMEGNMKRQVRSSVFETNSSSTHSIAISKKPVVIGKSIHFRIGEFGWENDCVDTADYLYTAILEQDDRDSLLDRPMHCEECGQSTVWE